MLSSVSPLSSRPIAKALTSILGCTTVREIEKVVHTACGDLIEAADGFVVIWEDSNQNLECASRDGQSALLGLASDLEHAAGATPHSVFYNDLTERGPAYGLACRFQVQPQNLLVAAILLEGESVGIIALVNKPGGFGPDDAGLASDIAEFATAALSNLKARELLDIFQALSDSSPIGIYVVQDGRFQFVNPQFQRLTGYSAQELAEMHALDIVAPVDVELVREQAVNMLKGVADKPYEYRIFTKVGELRWIMETVRSFEFRGKRAAVGSFIDITDRKSLETQLGHMAMHDPLTGVANRRLLEEGLYRAAARAARGIQSSLLFLDVDDFKLVNDTLGHSTGDKALMRIVELLLSMLRGGDLLARIGGDEFAVLLHGANLEQARMVGDRLRAAVCEADWSVLGHSFTLGLSIGVASIDGIEPVSAVLSHADHAMYKAKADGGNRVVLCAQASSILASTNSGEAHLKGDGSGN